MLQVHLPSFEGNNQLLSLCLQGHLHSPSLPALRWEKPAWARAHTRENIRLAIFFFGGLMAFHLLGKNTA